MNKYLCAIMILFSSFTWASSVEETRERLIFLYDKYQIYESFYYKLTKSILNKDIKAVASMNLYPLRVNSKSGNLLIKSKEEFIAKYDSIVTDKIFNAVKLEKFETLFANSTGMHIGDGDIWFTGYCIGKEIKKECEEVVVKVMAYNLREI
jgi:hypothetical protein